MQRIEKLSLILLAIVIFGFVGVIIFMLLRRKDKFEQAHLPDLFRAPPYKMIPNHTFSRNVPLGAGKTSDDLERYSLDNISSNGKNATFDQSYIEQPRLLDLPPYKKLLPPSKQRVHPVSGVPEGMYMGSDYMQSEYTPDYLSCKSAVI